FENEAQNGCNPLIRRCIIAVGSLSPYFPDLTHNKCVSRVGFACSQPPLPPRSSPSCAAPAKAEWPVWICDLQFGTSSMRVLVGAISDCPGQPDAPPAGPPSEFLDRSGCREHNTHESKGHSGFVRRAIMSGATPHRSPRSDSRYDWRPASP